MLFFGGGIGIGTGVGNGVCNTSTVRGDVKSNCSFSGHLDFI